MILANYTEDPRPDPRSWDDPRSEPQSWDLTLDWPTPEPSGSYSNNPQHETESW